MGLESFLFSNGTTYFHSNIQHLEHNTLEKCSNSFKSGPHMLLFKGTYSLVEVTHCKKFVMRWFPFGPRLKRNSGIN